MERVLRITRNDSARKKRNGDNTRRGGCFGMAFKVHIEPRLALEVMNHEVIKGNDEGIEELCFNKSKYLYP
jgi:hypothetical protein